MTLPTNTSPGPGARRGLADRDDDLLPVLAIAWVVSALRVAGALYAHQAFGVEATLALAAALVIPLVAWPLRARR